MNVSKQPSKETFGHASGDGRGLIFDIDRYAIHYGPGIRLLVFMKGCPLRCPWCCNPESQSFSREVAFFPARCIGCGACVESCPEKAMRMEAGRLFVDWQRCRDCGKCIERCFTDAKKLFGRLQSVEEIFEEVKKSLVFFKNSGGGVTVGGGEVTAQGGFVRDLLRRCKAEQVHTAIETCGHCSWQILAGILEFTDLVFYDIKHMDPKKHKESTGVSNRRILGNLVKVSREPVELIVRIPVIPGFNDDEANLRSAAEFIAERLDLSHFKWVELLPYHKLGTFKYDRLGKEYALKSVEVPGNEAIESLKEIFQSNGLSCKVGG